MSEMRTYVGLCLTIGQEAHGSMAALANEAGLSISTLYRLLHEQTRFPQFMTLQKIGKAAGLLLIVDSKGKPKLKVAS